MGIDGRRYDIRDGNRWKVIQYTEKGNDGKRCDTLRWEMMAGDTIHRDGNRRQAIRFTEMGSYCRRYDIQKWEMKAGDTI